MIEPSKTVTEKWITLGLVRKKVSADTLTGRWTENDHVAALFETQLNMDQDILNYHSPIKRTIDWARRKEFLKAADFVSVFMHELKATSPIFYRLSLKHIDCCISGDRVLKTLRIVAPHNFTYDFTNGRSTMINDVLKSYDDYSLAFTGEETPQPFEVSIGKIKNFNF